MVSANSYIFQIIILLNIKLTDGLVTVCFFAGKNSDVAVQVKDFGGGMPLRGNLSAEEPLAFFGKRDLSYNNLKRPVGYTPKVVDFGITHIGKLHTGGFAAVPAVAVDYNLLLQVGQ